VIRRPVDGPLPAAVADRQEVLWEAFVDCYSATATREVLDRFLVAIASLGRR
jgi:hypothetical protein